MHSQGQGQEHEPLHSVFATATSKELIQNQSELSCHETPGCAQSAQGEGQHFCRNKAKSTTVFV